MNPALLILPIALPAAGGLLTLALPSRRGAGNVRAGRLPGALAAFFGAAQLALAIRLFPADLSFRLPWLGYGIELALRLSRFSAFILLAIGGFTFLVALYAGVFMRRAPSGRPFAAWLLFTAALAGGAVLADNLVLLLVFWEGLLLTQFGMIAAGGNRSPRTAIKAFVIVGFTDLCLMLGVMLTGRLAGTLSISAIRLPLDGLGSAAFLLLFVGAMGKAGAMPFHSWIPDAAADAPLPFMAFLPGALEKLLGVYLLARICLDLFRLSPEGWVSTVLMSVGAVTILLAVLMALVQTDFKRLLAYHAISQFGYMILGIGTALPVGIIGGLFHMINNALYKSCLFLSAGSVERQAGTTDLNRLGGLGRAMPLTTTAFVVAALSISGVPPFNGFFSKELVYDGALERGWIFYAAALLGSFFTAASFLKLGHAAFFGRPAAGGDPSSGGRQAREAPWPMLLPMLVLAGVCILFGLADWIPVGRLIQPAVGAALAGTAEADGRSFAGWPAKPLLAALTAAALALAALNHWYGVRRTGRGAGAVEHIHHAPVLSAVYRLAERGRLDPYWIGGRAVKAAALALWGIDRAVDWVHMTLASGAALGLSGFLRRLHNGRVNRYLLWSIAGAIAVVLSAVALLGGRR